MDERMARVLAGERLRFVLKHKGRRGCRLWLWDLRKHSQAKKSYNDFWSE